MLGIVLPVHSIRSGGAVGLIQQIRRIKPELSEKSLYFSAIVAVLYSFIYLNIPRVDFFLSIFLCLPVLISLFYVDRLELFKKMYCFYLVGTLALFILVFFGIDKHLHSTFFYSMDIIVLAFIIVYAVFWYRLTRKSRELMRKFRITLSVSISVPLFLCPIFKYLLLVPLPTEGGIIGLMDLVRYSVF